MVETSRDVDEVYRIYGDNILECENFLDLLMENYEISRLRFEEKIGPIDRPLYLFFDEVREITTCLQMCAYYGGRGDDIDWTNNPLSNIFNEKVDVIITKVNDDHSESSPLLAIEYVNAIQAGNQGWQRSRRAINAAIHSIPYLFVLPMISWEPETDGLHLKSPRFLQAQSSFSQLVLCSKYGVPSLQIYQYSDMCDTAYREGYTLPENYRTYTGEDNVISIFSGILRKNYHPNETLKLKQTYEDIIRQMVEVARTYSNYGNTNFRIIHSHISFQPENIESVSELFAQSLISNDEVRGEYAIHNIDIDDFLINGFPFFKDAQSKTTTNHFREYILNKVNWKNNNTIEYKINYIKSWGYEPDSLITNEEISDIIVGGDGQFPLSYKKGKSEAAIIKNRGALRNIVATAYPELSVQVKDWIYPPSENNELPPLLLVPMYGYKPSGDSRPDRGLLPMLKSMFPSLARKNRVLVIMYSIHTPENWRDLLRQGNNELWNVIAELAGALIVDVTRDGILFDGGEV